MAKKYIVVWVEELGDTSQDNYRVFVDGDSDEENLEPAKNFYYNTLKKDVVSSANLSEILLSTDY
jgi:hypothetical protein